MSSEEIVDSDATIHYRMEEDRVPPTRTETPLAGAPAPEDRPPAPPKRHKRGRKRKKGGYGPKEEAIRLLPFATTCCWWGNNR